MSRRRNEKRAGILVPALATLSIILAVAVVKRGEAVTQKRGRIEVRSGAQRRDLFCSTCNPIVTEGNTTNGLKSHEYLFRTCQKKYGTNNLY